MYLLTTNCTWNNKKALRNEVDTKRNVLARVGLRIQIGKLRLERNPLGLN